MKNYIVSENNFSVRMSFWCLTCQDNHLLLSFALFYHPQPRTAPVIPPCKAEVARLKPSFESLTFGFPRDFPHDWIL